MNRKAFARIFAKNTNRKLRETEEFLEDFEKILLEALVTDGPISFHDFCKFGIKRTKPYKGKHPKDFSEINTAGKNKPYVKFGKRFREAILNSKIEVHEDSKEKEN